MATEIELKAHVRDSQIIKSLLHEKAEYVSSFKKEDIYWQEGHTRLRVRREKRTLPDGTTQSNCIATYKNKEVRDGIEINEEREFEVNPGPEFEEFLKRMGFTPDTWKRKTGWAFSREGITAELAEVEGLGWFIELEILAASGREETFAAEKKRLLDFLAILGIEKEAIESRFYTEMLKDTTAGH